MQKIRADIPGYAGILLFLVVIRLPSFFFSVFDWDESTLIIVGQSILNGSLPYVDAWDIKPPLAYYVYALFILLFGTSLLSIRLGGLLCIYVASMLLYQTGKALENKAAGMSTALLLTVFASSGPSGLSTMTEHILLVPISLVIYLLLTANVNRKRVFIAGMTLGMSILIKTSMIFEVLAFLFLLSAGFLQPSSDISERTKKSAILLMGISLPIVMMVCYYFAKNNLDTFFKTNIAVLHYIGAAPSFREKFVMFSSNIWENLSLNPLLWITSFLGTLSFTFRKETRPSFFSAMLVIFCAQMLSLFVSGQPFGYHYLITSMPVLCLVSGVALSRWFSDEKLRGRMSAQIVTVTALVAGALYSLQGDVVKRYGEIISRLVQRQPLLDDSCYRIAHYLEKDNVRGDYIYMVNSCQIVYWLTGSKCPTKYVHPSNVMLREYMLKIVDGPDATKEMELRTILSKHPRFIIFRTDLWPRELDAFKTILDRELAAHYEELPSVDKYHKTYERKND